MQFEDKSISGDVSQNVIMENRSRVSISGVSDVENFDENSVVVRTNRGTLTLRGSGLHVERLNLETGELAIEGSIDGMEYSGEMVSEGFWSRLFKG